MYEKEGIDIDDMSGFTEDEISQARTFNQYADSIANTVIEVLKPCL